MDAKRFYILPASDNTGDQAHGPYTKSEARLRARRKQGGPMWREMGQGYTLYALRSRPT